MDYSQVEAVILDRFLHKSLAAGGPRLGYVLRRNAICWVESEHVGLDFGAGLDGLVEKGLLSRNEDGEFFFLTAEGLEVVQQRRTACAQDVD